jgi:hypothetical protein
MTQTTFAPGTVITNRNRLWRVDAQAGDVLIATPIDGGSPEPQQFYIPLENIRPGRLEPPSPQIVGHPSSQDLLLRAELDTLYAHLYGLTREDLDCILDTFPIVRRKDEARYGDFRTRRLVLEYYEWLEPLKH